MRAVVRGVEQDDSKPAKVWNQQYMEIPMGKIYSRRGTDITASYSLNDATAADLDGDGEYEIIVKRIYDPDGLFDVPNDSAYAFFEAYKLDGTKLWAIDVGPNMINSGHVETNIIAYDWDLDGKAEVLMRATDGTIIRDAEGRQQAVVGDLKANYRDQISHSGNMTYATAGNEYLIYMEGATAQLYGEPMEFPLKRFEAGGKQSGGRLGRRLRSPLEQVLLRRAVPRRTETERVPGPGHLHPPQDDCLRREPADARTHRALAMELQHRRQPVVRTGIPQLWHRRRGLGRTGRNRLRLNGD